MFIFNTRFNTKYSNILYPIMDKRIGRLPPLTQCQYYRYCINNLEVLYIKDADIKRTYVAMAVDCGSRDDTVPGLAHLLEHLLFISPDNEDDDIAEVNVTGNNGCDDTADNNVVKGNINDFDSFLNIYDGDSNAYTTDDETVYHYELDNAGVAESFRLFSNFFRNPLIYEDTIKNELQVVDAEFQNSRRDDEVRVHRLLEISLGKKFTFGSLQSLGNDYKMLKQKCRELYKSKYRKMALVVCSSMENSDMEEILRKYFSFDLDKIVYGNRTCKICENCCENKNIDEDGKHANELDDQFANLKINEQPHDDSHNKSGVFELKIRKIYKYKPIFPKKRIIISFPFPSYYMQPFNVYNSIVYFFSREDSASLFHKLKVQQLIFNGSVSAETTLSETLLIFDFTVRDTGVYTIILDMICYFFRIYKKTQELVSFQSKTECIMDWYTSAEDNFREHVIECAEKILRDGIIFTDTIFDHECHKLRLNDCTIILVDGQFVCQKRDDEYELCYEEITNNYVYGTKYESDECPTRTKTESIVKYASNFFAIKTVMYDEDIGNTLKMIKNDRGTFLFVKDISLHSDATVLIFLEYKTSIYDVIKLAELMVHFNVLYDQVFKSHAISISHKVCCDGVLFEMSGTDLYFVLVNLFNSDEVLRMMSDRVVVQNVLNSIRQNLEDTMYDSGYRRVAECIKDIYIEGFQSVEHEHGIVMSLIDKLPAHLFHGNCFNTSSVIPFEKVQNITFIVNGHGNENSYTDIFVKICNRMKSKCDGVKIQINQKYMAADIVFDYLKRNAQEDSKDVLDMLEKQKSHLVINKTVNAVATIKARNKSNAVFFKIGKGIRSLIICKILVCLMSEKFFTSLRTEQGLGYIVYCDYTSIRDIHFLYFNVQSESDALLRIFEFIENFDISLRPFDSLKNKIMAKMHSRSKICRHYFNILYTRYESVTTYRKDLCDLVDNITVDDLKQSLKESEISVISAEKH